MADRTPGQRQHQRPTTALGGGGGGQIMGIKTLIISGGILLILTGLTLTTAVLGLIFLSPLIILTSPIWIPIGTILMIILFGFLWICGFGVATILGCTWIYNYIRGRHPFGSERVDYARSRIAGTANQMRDYAREYSGYLQSKVIKDVAPGA